MKAVSVHKLGLDTPVVVEDLSAPQAGLGQVVVRVRAAGVNPLEISIRSGNHPRSKMMQLPMVCGTDVSGEVETVGEGVETQADAARLAALGVDAAQGWWLGRPSLAAAA